MLPAELLRSRNIAPASETRTERIRATLRALLASDKYAPNWGAWAPASTSSFAIPVITQATSTSLASGTTFFADPVDQPNAFNLLGGEYRIAGGGFPLNSVVRAFGLDSPFGIMPIQIEFWTNAPVFEVIVRQGGATSARSRCFVNGQICDVLATTLGGSAGQFPRHIIHTFTDGRPRHIRIELYDADISGIRVGTGFAVWPVELRHNRRPRCVVLGDSFTEGTGGAVPGLNSFAFRLGQATGWEIFASGSGGTGYLNPGPNSRKTFRQRLQTDVISQRPDVVIIAGGINDSGSSASQIETEAGLVFDALFSALPQVALVVLGPWCPNDTPSGFYLTHRDAIRNAAVSRGALFVDNIGELWINSTNRQAYHPTGLTATATATVSGGAVTGVSITSGGNGYGPSYAGTAGLVTFTGGGGTGAAGTLTTDGRIQCVNVLAGGVGYDNTTTVTFVGGGGTGATATATVVNGEISGITVTNPGTGYTSQPSVVITGPSGSAGAVATCAQTFVVTGVTVTAGGSGYSSAPSVSITAPADPTHPTDAGHGYLAERILFALGR